MQKQPRYSYVVFILMSAILLFTKYAVFSSYNGADDLHYALLSSRMLTHQFNAFLPYDAFAGRMIPIACQAIWFKCFGMNDYTMQLPSLIVLILLAFIVCFKSRLPQNPLFTALAAALVYFNPVVFQSTLGNLPDIYIALLTCGVLLLLQKQWTFAKDTIRDGLLIGLLLTAGLLIKETIVFIDVSVFISLWVFRKKMAPSFFYTVALSVLAGCMGWALLFYIKTGDPFFRFQQLKNNSYLNGCSYQCYSAVEMLQRLTIQMPNVFMQSGFFPVLMIVPIFFSKHKWSVLFSPRLRFFIVSFIILALTAIYFPLSIRPYVPLCHDNRQFLFLLPLAVLLFISALNEVLQWDTKDKRLFFGTGAAVLFCSVIVNLVFAPFNKWMIMDESLLGLCFAMMMSGKEKIVRLLAGVAVPIILWLSVAYPLYKKQDHGYAALKEMRGMQSAMRAADHESHPFFYFTDHDTKMQYALADQFNPATNYISLDTVEPGLIPYRQYQPEGMFKDSSLFKPGWVILNPGDTPMDSVQLNKIYHLLGQQTAMSAGNVHAYFVASSMQLQQLLTVINDTSKIKPRCGCGK